MADDLRSEYSKLRSIARKRVERFGQGEFNWTQSYRKAFIQFATEFRPLESIGRISNADLAQKIKDLKVFIENKEYSTRGLQKIRAKSIDTLHDNGYDFVTRANWREWTEFLDWYRDQHGKNYGSPTREEMKTYLDDLKTGMSPEEARRLFKDYEKSHKK